MYMWTKSIISYIIRIFLIFLFIYQYRIQSTHSQYEKVYQYGNRKETSRPQWFGSPRAPGKYRQVRTIDSLVRCIPILSLEASTPIVRIIHSIAEAFTSCDIAHTLVSTAIIQTVLVLAVVSKIWFVTHATASRILDAAPAVPTAILGAILCSASIKQNLVEKNGGNTG